MGCSFLELSLNLGEFGSELFLMLGFHTTKYRLRSMIGFIVAKSNRYFKTKIQSMDILTLGWVTILALFSWSIAMVVWGRNGF